MIFLALVTASSLRGVGERSVEWAKSVGPAAWVEP